MKNEMINNSLYDQALRLIRSRACEGVSIKNILAHLKISRSTLARQFKLHLGHTAAQELFLIRMARAKELLSTTDLPVKRIALMIGCNTASNFCNMFLNQVGISPGEFRAQHGLINSNPDNVLATKETPSRHSKKPGSQKSIAFAKNKTKRHWNKPNPTLDCHEITNVMVRTELFFASDTNMQLI